MFLGILNLLSDIIVKMARNYYHVIRYSSMNVYGHGVLDFWFMALLKSFFLLQTKVCMALNDNHNKLDLHFMFSGISILQLVYMYRWFTITCASLFISFRNIMFQHPCQITHRIHKCRPSLCTMYTNLYIRI